MSGVDPYRTWPVPQYSSVPAYSNAPSADGYYSTAVSPGESEAGSVFSSSSEATHMTVPAHPSFAGIDGGYYLPDTTVMPCEFQTLTGCPYFFGSDQQDDWIVHHIQDHLKEKYPSKLRCPLCDQYLFDARARSVSREINFWDRMKHWAYHYATGENVGPPRIDHHIVDHIYRLRIIDLTRYQTLMQETEMPLEFREAIASGVQSHNFVTERDRKNHRRDTQVIKSTADEDRERRKHRHGRH